MCVSSLVARNAAKVLDAVKFDRFPGACLVESGRVDRPPFLLLSVSTDGVEMLQGKSERIDHPVARLARFGLGLKRDALAGRQVRMEIGSERSDGLRRWPKHPAQHARGR